MFNLQTYNQEMEEEYKTLVGNYTREGKVITSHGIAEFWLNKIHFSHTQLLKQFLEGECEIIKKELYEMNSPEESSFENIGEYSSWRGGKMQTLTEKLTHYQNLIKELV